MRELTPTEISAVSAGDIVVTGPIIDSIIDILFLPVAIVAGGIEWLWGKVFG